MVVNWFNLQPLQMLLLLCKTIEYTQYITVCGNITLGFLYGGCSGFRKLWCIGILSPSIIKDSAVNTILHIPACGSYWLYYIICIHTPVEMYQWTGRTTELNSFEVIQRILHVVFTGGYSDMEVTLCYQYIICTYINVTSCNHVIVVLWNTEARECFIQTSAYR